MKCWHIKNYDEIYRPRNTKGQEYKKLNFAKLPFHYRSEEVESLLEEKNGLNAYGIFTLLLQKASDYEEILLRGWLFNHKKEPASDLEIAKSIQLKGKKAKVEKLLKLLEDVGLIEFIDFPFEKSLRRRSVSGTDRGGGNQNHNPKKSKFKSKEIKEEQQAIGRTENSVLRGLPVEAPGILGNEVMSDGMEDERFCKNENEGMKDEEVTGGLDRQGVNDPFSKAEPQRTDTTIRGSLPLRITIEEFLEGVDVKVEDPAIMMGMPNLASKDEHREMQMSNWAMAWLIKMIPGEWDPRGANQQRITAAVNSKCYIELLMKKAWERGGEKELYWLIGQFQKRLREGERSRGRIYNVVGLTVKDIQDKYSIKSKGKKNDRETC